MIRKKPAPSCRGKQNYPIRSISGKDFKARLKILKPYGQLPLRKKTNRSSMISLLNWISCLPTLNWKNSK